MAVPPEREGAPLLRSFGPLGGSLGVRALATHPRGSGTRGAGERDAPLAFTRVTLEPGRVLCAGEPGIVPSPIAHPL